MVGGGAILRAAQHCGGGATTSNDDRPDGIRLRLVALARGPRSVSAPAQRPAFNHFGPAAGGREAATPLNYES